MKRYPKRIYLSATWKGDDRGSTVQIANLIANYGVTVVRDHEANKTGDPLKTTRTWVQRVDSMLRDCSGLVVVLPYNSKNPQTTSPFLIPELLAADAQGIPILLFANPGVVTKPVQTKTGIEFQFPNSAQNQMLRVADVFRWGAHESAALDSLLMNAGGFALSNARNVIGPLEYPNSKDHRATAAAIEDFVEACPARDPYSFVFNVLPFSLKDSVHQAIASAVFKATGMACHISLDAITGEQSVRRNWEVMLQRSDLVIAELSSLRDTCLFETGCAIGLGKRVFVLSKKGQQALPFGLDDHSFHEYHSMDELVNYVRDTCCGAHRRELFNLSNDFKSQHADSPVPPGVPAWLTQTRIFSLENRLTISIWAIFLSLAFAVQIGVKLAWPSSPTPNILAVFSALSGFLAWTRVSREFWEKTIGKWLSWLPWVGMTTVAVLIAALLLLMIQKQESATPNVPPHPATSATGK
jgi:hypothetical protein